MQTRTRGIAKVFGALILGFTLIFTGSPARADMISPPPRDCPPGSQGQMCHGPSHCAPMYCTENSQCQSGMTCQPLNLCIRPVNCGGRVGRIVDSAMSLCQTGKPCTRGTCQNRQVCVAPPAPEGPPPANDSQAPSPAPEQPSSGVETRTAGVSCQISSPRNSSGALLMALIPALFLLGMKRLRLKR